MPQDGTGNPIEETPMHRFELPLKHFIADEAGYDLVEFAMAAALASSVAFVALKNQSASEIFAWIHSNL
jgi:hypothetical protein